MGDAHKMACHAEPSSARLADSEGSTHMLLAAAILIFVTGCAHTYLGERYLLIRLFKRGNLPPLLGGTAFTQGTLRFAWHITTVAWWAFAWILVDVHLGRLSAARLLDTLAIAALVSALLPILYTRGRHLSWIVFLLVAALLYAARNGAY